MTTAHLSEETLQQYVLDKTSANAIDTAHLQNCPSCQALAAAYAGLFADLQATPDPAFEFDLAAMVVARLPALQPTPTFDHTISYLLIAALAAIAVPIYLLRSNIARLFTVATPLFTCSAAIIITAVLLFQTFDHFKKYQQKMQALDFS